MNEAAPEYLFDLSQLPVGEKRLSLKNLEAPVWTENKANLIRRYLRYFVFITKHGTYIDGFAAPQSPDHADVSCAAKLVLANEPKWLRNFILFDLNDDGIDYLNKLAAAENNGKRSVIVNPGDTNATLPAYLAANQIPDKEAAFCLLDQRTFECDWATVEAVARHKKGGNKIEIFYFLAQGWLDRSVAPLKDRDKRMRQWWGDDSWQTLLQKAGNERGQFLAERFKRELGYRYSYAYPIWERDDMDRPGKVMFWMVHASDHEEAPKLMVRAYNNAVAPLEPVEQLEMEIVASP